MYKDKKTVSSVKYEKTYFSNGKIKHEGWMIWENPTSKSEVSVNSDSVNSVGSAFGVWKFYFRNGAVLSIDSNGTSDTAIKRQYFYFKNGCLKKIVIIKPLTTPYKTRDMKFAGKVKHYEWLKRQLYYCSEIWAEEFFINSGQPSGIWKYYKNNKVVKTEEFDKDGHLIVTKKYGT